MTRPINNQPIQQQQQEGKACKVCGHKTTTKLVVVSSQLNKHRVGEELPICHNCHIRKCNRKSFDKTAIEVFKMNDWASNNNNKSLLNRKLITHHNR